MKIKEIQDIIAYAGKNFDIKEFLRSDFSLFWYLFSVSLIILFEEIFSNKILLENNLLNDLLPSKRKIAMVFQSYALYPHMSVFQNKFYSGILLFYNYF